MDCTKCGRKNIKYLCIFRKTPICNVCSVACSDKTPGYSEENFLVGKCNEDSCESSRTTQKPSGFSAAKPKPRQSDRQTTLLGFFNKTPVSISDRSKTDFDRAKIKLTGHFDRRPISRYIEPCLYDYICNRKNYYIMQLNYIYIYFLLPKIRYSHCMRNRSELTGFCYPARSAVFAPKTEG